MADHMRIDGKTPGGGDYSEIWFMNDSGNVVDEKEATRCVIRECRSDGTLISETFGFVRKKKEDT